MTEKVHLHASCVALSGKAAVILGPSGSGKSTLALQLIGQGAQLVSDDGVLLSIVDGAIMAVAPESIAGKLEVRGVGILSMPHSDQAPVEMFVDLEREESERLPPFRTYEILGQKAPLYHRVKGDHFAVALTQILKNGRSD